MKKCLLIILLTALFSPSIYAQAKKDTLFFTNGTKVVGILKKIKVGVVTFDPDWANDITVQLKRINTINAGREIYRVESTKKHVYFGVLMQDSVPHSVRIVNGVIQSSLGMEEIVNLYPYSDRIMRRFSGDFGLGYNYTRSSSYGRLNLDGTLNYLAKNQETGISVSTVYSVTDSGMTRDREDASIKTNYYFSPTSFVSGFLAYQTWNWVSTEGTSKAWALATNSSQIKLLMPGQEADWYSTRKKAPKEKVPETWQNSIPNCSSTFSNSPNLKSNSILPKPFMWVSQIKEDSAAMENSIYPGRSCGISK
jgi:hypothetical protein